MTIRERFRDPATQRWLRIGVFVLLFLFSIWAPFYFAPFRVFQFTRVLIFAVAVLGLGLLTGFNGQISLGHGSFFAIGAYTAAVLMVKAGWPFLLVVPVALVITFALGYGVGIPALRLHGLYLALVTLALAVVTPPILKRFSGLTGGAMGLTVPKPATPEWTGLAEDQFLYFVALIAAIIVFVLARNLINSRVGRALIAIREDERAAETMGVNLAQYKTLAFAWSAMYAGLAGVLFTWTIGFVSPDSFTIVLSIELLAALVVGGLGSIWGPLVGATFLVFIPNVAEDINQAAPGIAFGALLILAMYVFPGGVAGVGRRFWGRLLAGGGATSGEIKVADAPRDQTGHTEETSTEPQSPGDEPVARSGHSEEGAP
ncbi:MAG: branched-chain amino acid ABC transporter permease [Nitriliruptorales bacterium]|nr:branched-chain amino acid ABC transporter permease [Nitriliruptorales bacterium]